MKEDDLDAVLLIEQASFPVPWKRQHFLDELVSPHAFPLVAISNGGSLGGYLCLTVLLDEAEVLDVAVAPEKRGQGIARLLLEHAEVLSRQNGALVLLLEVRATNTTAISLYRQTGFAACGVRRGYYEGKDDAVLMEKQLY